MELLAYKSTEVTTVLQMSVNSYEGDYEYRNTTTDVCEECLGLSRDGDLRTYNGYELFDYRIVDGKIRKTYYTLSK